MVDQQDTLTACFKYERPDGSRQCITKLYTLQAERKGHMAIFRFELQDGTGQGRGELRTGSARTRTPEARYSTHPVDSRTLLEPKPVPIFPLPFK